MSHNITLTPREEEVLKVIWSSSSPLTASEISKNGNLSVNTVQVVLRKLLKSNLIKIVDIVYSGTVLCRNYSATNLGSELIVSKFSDDFSLFSKRISPGFLFAAMIENGENKEEIIAALEELIAKKRQSQGRE